MWVDGEAVDGFLVEEVVNGLPRLQVVDDHLLVVASAVHARRRLVEPHAEYVRPGHYENGKYIIIVWPSAVSDTNIISIWIGIDI